MANLQSLPPELLEMIYRSLGSIDDVHYLGRACKKTCDIIQRPVIYVGIMRSVIGEAPQHRYDLQLCKMLDLHKSLVARMQQDSSQLPATRPNPFGYALNDWESAVVTATTPTTCDEMCCTNCLPDETVYSILARYQGLRVLEDLWLERQLNASDFFSADESPDANALSIVRGYQVVVNRSELYRHGEIPTRRTTTPETSDYTALNADQRARFYSAVTCVWLLNEIRWVFTNVTYPTRFDVQRKLLEACKEKFSGQRRMPLLDELDQYAVFKFMYHHLLPMYSTSLADEGVANLPFTFSTNFNKDFGYTSRYVDRVFESFSQRQNSYTDLNPDYSSFS